jgi:hypothetical protein
MAREPASLVGRVVAVWRPELGLLTSWARATVLECTAEHQTVRWLWNGAVERVCFRSLGERVRLVDDRAPAGWARAAEARQCQSR